MNHFRDARYGGREAALRAALKRRDELEAHLPPPSRIKRRFKRNTTGVVGVEEIVRRRNGRIRRYYCASWRERDGRPKTRTFSAALYGEARAWELAVRARREAVRRILSEWRGGQRVVAGRPRGAWVWRFPSKAASRTRQS